MKRIVLACVSAVLLSPMALMAADRPNILTIWGDDIGVHNVSAYNNGIMGYQTPNIDRIANEGMLFTHAYAQQSCTAGRAAFVLGQHPFRTGLLTIGMPGSTHGIPDWTPTIGDVLKEQGYMTGQFGKNHLGDQDEHLPTRHGFDEFLGNLYHLNAEEEPETYYYPKDAEFREKYGPRGVIHSFADGRVEDTGPLNRKRMETVDEEIVAAAIDFMGRAVAAEKPFFVWLTTTRMHVFTHLRPEADGVTGIGLYPDGMVEHDKHVGQVLDWLDEQGIADNTIVIYSTDNGAETFSWPDGGITPFEGEKGTTYEGGMRVPMMVRWPGKIAAGAKSDAIISHEDWMPTFANAAGIDDLPGQLKAGFQANGREWRVHLDGYDFTDYLMGEVEEGPRDSIYYFDAGGNLNAVRWNDWKVTFTVAEGNITEAVRVTPSWPIITHLKADPYEVMKKKSEMYTRWYADNMWLFVPVQQKVQAFLKTIPDYPFQAGSSLSAAGINYQTLKTMDIIRQLENKDVISR
ncbi:MAG: arylsulfatase [Cellvibrionales bacterium]